jgi:hypothetical protein
MGGPIQGNIQEKHVDARLSQDSKLSFLRVLAHKSPDTVFGQSSYTGNARELIQGSHNADVRIETASRRSDKINRNGAGIYRVGRLEGSDPISYGIEQCRVEWPLVRSGRSTRIVRKRHRCGGPAPKIFWIVERLTDELGAEESSIFLDKAAVGLGGEDSLGYPCDQKGIDQPGDHCKDQKENGRRHYILQYHGIMSELFLSESIQGA